MHKYCHSEKFWWCEDAVGFFILHCSLCYKNLDLLFARFLHSKILEPLRKSYHIFQCASFWDSFSQLLTLLRQERTAMFLCDLFFRPAWTENFLECCSWKWTEFLAFPFLWNGPLICHRNLGLLQSIKYFWGEIASTCPKGHELLPLGLNYTSLVRVEDYCWGGIYSWTESS